MTDQTKYYFLLLSESNYTFIELILKFISVLMISVTAMVGEARVQAGGRARGGEGRRWSSVTGDYCCSQPWHYHARTYLNFKCWISPRAEPL